MKKNTITEVRPGSIAEEVGIGVGDELIAVNGQAVVDIIDYLFLISDEYVEVEIRCADGEILVYEIEKEYDEELGLTFGNPLLDDARSCSNQCVFCFIDQLPKGMRETLYFKDDDSRLSFMQGNFVTLTNVSYEQLDRIIRYRISPINVSVHTTDPDLRVKLLGNRHAGDVLEKMRRLAEGNIEMNAQIVLMPGVNDDQGLDKTLEDLAQLYPQVRSVAMVPVGLSRYREGLAKLSPYSESQASELIERVSAIQERLLEQLGTRFAFLSDEFYLLAGKDLPNHEFYEGYIQLENGVGLIRKFAHGFVEALGGRKSWLQGSYRLLTGTLAKTWLSDLLAGNGFNSLSVQAIENRFFGPLITVSGLVCAKDIHEQVTSLEGIDGIIIPDVMLKSDEPVFLDDVTVKELSAMLGLPVYVCETTGQGLINLLEELK